MEYAISFCCTVVFFLILLTSVGAIGTYVNEKYGKKLPLFAWVALVILCVICSLGTFFIIKWVYVWLFGASDAAPSA